MKNDKVFNQNEQAIFAIGHTNYLQLGNPECLAYAE